LGSCVHPHRPWSKSHTLSDDAVSTAEAESREEGGERVSARAKGHKKVRDASSDQRIIHSRFTEWISSSPLPLHKPRFLFTPRTALPGLTCGREGDGGGVDVSGNGWGGGVGRRGGFCGKQTRHSSTCVKQSPHVRSLWSGHIHRVCLRDYLCGVSPSTEPYVREGRGKQK